jgi:basic membrane lipoprotein Med (substrate-binding protein (PBP1-ABC) superfamily)
VLLDLRLPPRAGRRRTAAVLLAGVLLAVTTGCGSTPAPLPAASSASSAAAAGPVPGATVAATVDPEATVPAGLHVAVAGTDAGALDAADDVLAGLGATATRVDLTGEDADAVLAAAAEQGPDVLVVIGAGALDAVDRVSSGRLEQRFLVVGAQLPEPTENVTAVVWPGAESRWADAGLDADDDLTSRLAAALPVGLGESLAERGAVVLDLG